MTDRLAVKVHGDILLTGSYTDNLLFIMQYNARYIQHLGLDIFIIKTKFVKHENRLKS